LAAERLSGAISGLKIQRKLPRFEPRPPDVISRTRNLPSTEEEQLQQLVPRGDFYVSVG